MKKRQLGNSDLFVTEMGLGCMSLGTSETEAMHIIDEAIDLGINFFDTADLYDYGLNEEFVGKALKGRRDQIVLTTKVGNRWTEEKNGWSWDPSKAYIKTEVKESLRRLQTDYIDLYQLHGGTIEDPIDETIEAFEELKKEGIIRHYGISSIRPNVVREYAKRSNIVSVLMEYSLLNRRPEEWFPLLNEHQISVIARGPLAKGILTDNNARKIERVKEKDYHSYSYPFPLCLPSNISCFSSPSFQISNFTSSASVTFSFPCVTSACTSVFSPGLISFGFVCTATFTASSFCSFFGSSLFVLQPANASIAINKVIISFFIIISSFILYLV